MDFNPWGQKTDALLFDWTELEQASRPELPEMRVISSSVGIRPSVAMRSMLPFDLQDFSDGSAMAEYLQKIMQEQQDSTST